MFTRMAIIGSTEFIERIQSVASLVGGIELDSYIYKQPHEAPLIIKDLKPCDVVFFSGALPYFFSKKEHEKLPVPVIYLAQDELAIASSLLASFYHKHISLDRVSIDLFNASLVKNVLTSVDIDTLPEHIIDLEKMLNRDVFDLAALVSFHKSLWEKGAIDLALTSVHAVYNQLIEHGIPAMRMADPKITLIRGLQEAKSQANYAKSQSAQVAVGYVSIHATDKEHERLIRSFAHDIHATVQQLTHSSYTLYSTRGDIEGVIEQDLFLEYLTDFPEIAIGFGYGSTIIEADKNAIVALSFAEKELNKNCAYILTNEKELIGPFPEEQRQQRLINDSPAFLQIAQKAKLSPANLSKIIQFGKVRQSHHFTAADLSDYLQVTRRTTERMIKKLVEHGYIHVVGEEMTYQQGRPRAVYILNMPIYN